MYTIKQAAARTGLSVPIIRVWERRYGVVQPGRTPAGYRLYDDEAIARLAAMHHLVADEGWQPRQAAQRVLEDGVDLQALQGDSSGAGAALGLASRAGPSERDAFLADAFFLAAHGLDVPAMERILDECFAAQRFELAIERVVSPALRSIGSAWANGEMDVGAEHAASETVRRRLARFFDAAGIGDRVPRAIVGLPPGSHHEIGAFAFAVASRRAGLDVLYLGANVPVESWLRTVQETAAPAVVLGVAIQADVDAAGQVVNALRALAGPPTCFIGGPLALDEAVAPGTSLLPSPLDEAVATVRELLGSGKKPVR